MEWSWLPPAALIGSVLVFVVSLLRLLVDRSAINRFAMLAKARADLPESCEANEHIDEALVSLSEKIAAGESPKDITGVLSAWSMVLAALGIGAAASLPFFTDQAGSDESWMLVLAVAGAVGALTSMIGSLFLVRRSRAREESLARLAIGLARSDGS